MVERNVPAMIKAIRDWEHQAGESFTDYFLDNYPLGSWAYFLLGKGYKDWANKIINMNESNEYVDQSDKFEWFDAYQSGDWKEEDYLLNVKIWAEFLVESDQYYRRVNDFFVEYDKEDD